MRTRPNELDEESRELWKELRRVNTKGRSLGDVLCDMGILKIIPDIPWPEKDEPAECCRTHLRILATMERVTGDPERRKRFRFCPECGRRSM